MVKTKPVDLVVKKWQERASVATDDYKFGVMNPKKDWATAAEAAFDAWAKGVQTAIAEKRFVGGVRKAGTEKWRRKAVEVGADRYAPGIRAAADEYAAAMTEVLRVIEGVDLPPRGPKGDPRNYERVVKIGDALHKWAIARKRA